MAGLPTLYQVTAAAVELSPAVSPLSLTAQADRVLRR